MAPEDEKCLVIERYFYWNDSKTV